LSRINLSRTEFTAKAGKHLLRVLTEKPNITAVRLSHNDIGQSGGQILGAYLTVGSRLSILDISDTNVGYKALKAVRHTFSRFRLLHAVLIAVRAMTRQIGRGLKENRSITVLKLSNNEFDKKSATALAEALEVNRTLQCLALVQCCFPKVCAPTVQARPSVWVAAFSDDA
jgi:Ran GTPase-activating protein (RanGAP) involved in mRNA processing and transport